MPTSPLEVYFPVLIQILLATALAAGLVGASFLLGKKVKNKIKDMPYESGMVPIGTASERFSVKFYLVAMLFILFDIEAVFLYPWVVVFQDLKMFAFLDRYSTALSSSPSTNQPPAVRMKVIAKATYHSGHTG